MTTERERLQLALIAAVRANPLDESPRLILADFLSENMTDENVDSLAWAVEALRSNRVPLTGVDHQAIASLAACRFFPGSFDKRFARDISGLTDCGKYASLTPKQYLWLWRLVHRYRRQICNATVNDLAERAANGRPMRDPDGPRQRELFAADEVRAGGAT